MNNYEIYVKTSAIGQSGIHWRHIISDEQHLTEAPPLLEEHLFKHKDGFNVGINDLFNEVSPSLLIFKNKEKIMLEVAGIESPERSKRMGRKVLNLIAWITDNNQDGDTIIRKIAYDVIQYLLGKQNKIESLINTSIDFYETEEFRVDSSLVDKYISELDNVKNESEMSLSQEIALSSEEKLEKLAEIIQTFSLPMEWEAHNYTSNLKEIKSEGVIIVVTNRLEQEDLFYYAGVWRGFASNVEEPQSLTKSVIFTESPHEVPVHQENLIDQGGSNPPKKLPMLLITIVLIISLVVTVMILKPKIFLPSPHPNPSKQEESREHRNTPLIPEVLSIKE